MKAKISLLLVLPVTLMALAGFVLWLFHKPARDEIVRFVPADAVAYAHLYLRPSTQQQLAIRDLLERLPVDVENAEELKEALGRLLDPVLAVSGMTYKRDVSVWLGDQMAFFALPEGAGQAVLLEVKGDKDDLAREASEKALLKRPQLSSETVGDLIVIGNPEAVSAVSTTASNEGASLIDEESYSSAVDKLVGDRTLTVFASQHGAGIAATGWARSDGATLDISVPGEDMTEITPGNLAELLGKLDEADVLPLDRFGGLLQTLDEAGPQVLTALQLSGVMSEGTDAFDSMLGDGYESSLVVDAGRLEALSGFLDMPQKGSGGVLELARYISHIVLGTRSDQTLRIFIGVK
jgi:hypothetical protein